MVTDRPIDNSPDIEITIRWNRREMASPIKDGEYEAKVEKIEPVKRKVRRPDGLPGIEYAWRIHFVLPSEGKQRVTDYVVLWTDDRRRIWLTKKLIEFLRAIGIEDAVKNKKKKHLRPEDLDVKGEMALRLTLKTKRLPLGEKTKYGREWITRVVQYEPLESVNGDFL